MAARQKLSKIDRIRAIVETSTAGKVEGQLLDLFSASAIIKVYDNIKPEQQKKYLTVPVYGMAEMAFKLLK